MKRFWTIASYIFLALSVAGGGAYLALSILIEQTQEVQVPNLADLSLSEALNELSLLGLDLEVRSFVYSDEVGENRIVRQRPLAGVVVKSGRGVGVAISRGAERHPVPDIRGISLEDARILLGESGLNAQVGARIKAGPEGVVVALGVEPGEPLKRGAGIELIESSGPKIEKYRMPRLSGLTVEGALLGLDEFALRPTKIVEVEAEDPASRGFIVKQDPLPGFPVSSETEIVLTAAGEADRTEHLRSIWIAKVMPLGFSRHRVQVIVEGGGGPWEMADQWLPGGQVFRLWTPIGPTDAVKILVDGKLTETALYK